MYELRQVSTMQVDTAGYLLPLVTIQGRRFSLLLAALPSSVGSDGMVMVPVCGKHLPQITQSPAYKPCLVRENRRAWHGIWHGIHLQVSYYQQYVSYYYYQQYSTMYALYLQTGGSTSVGRDDIVQFPIVQYTIGYYTGSTCQVRRLGQSIPYLQMYIFDKERHGGEQDVCMYVSRYIHTYIHRGKGEEEQRVESGTKVLTGLRR